MKKEQITIPEEHKQKLLIFLQNLGFAENQINQILNVNYSVFQNETDLIELFGAKRNYQKILQFLSDGYTMGELQQMGVTDKEIQSFMETLDSYNISVDNAKAINQYSNGSNMILSIKKKTASREDIQSGIMQDLFEKLQIRGMGQTQITEVNNFIQQLDYSRPIHNNYDMINSYMEEMNLPKNCFPSICKTIKDINSLEHIDETISSLDEGLSRTRLPQSMKLYRAIKTNTQVNVQNYIGNTINNQGYISTSPLYDSSFAKYDEYDTVLEIYAPKGTQGAYIMHLSDYDDVEQEVLLNPNNIYILNAQTGIIDKNGKSKTVLTGLLLSRERECYKGITQSDTDEQSKSQEDEAR